MNDNSTQHNEYFRNSSKAHTNISILEERWADAKEEFIKLINPNEKYLWKTSSETMKDPLWYDLDLKYIENLLNKKIVIIGSSKIGVIYRNCNNSFYYNYRYFNSENKK